MTWQGVRRGEEGAWDRGLEDVARSKEADGEDRKARRDRRIHQRKIGGGRRWQDSKG